MVAPISRRLFWSLAALLAVVMVWQSTAHAQIIVDDPWTRFVRWLFGGGGAATPPNDGTIPTDNILDEVIRQYRLQANRWRGTLSAAAERIFWLLVSIDIAWSIASALLRMAPVERLFSVLVERIILVGFFFHLLRRGRQIAFALTDFFHSAGVAGAGIDKASPSSLVDMGLSLLDKTTDVMTWSAPGTAVILFVSLLFVLVALAFSAARMVAISVKAAVVVNAGVIMLGFGGTGITRSFATAYFRYAIGVGLQLMLMVLVVGIGSGFLGSWIEFGGEDIGLKQMVIILIVAIVLVGVVFEVPSLAMSLAQGTVVGGSGIARAVGGAVAAAGAAVGGTVALGYAGSKAFSSAGETHPTAGAFQKSIIAAKMVSQSVATQGLGRVMDVPGSRYGSTMGRVAAMEDQRLKKHRGEQQEPSTLEAAPAAQLEEAAAAKDKDKS